MSRRVTILVLCAAMWLLPGAFAFQTDTSSLARNFNRTLALTNSQIVITVNFTNDGTVASRGFFYTDQVPSGLSVSTLSVMLNGRAVTNYLFESGQDGDVYAGCTPYRWVLEQPTNFAEANPIPPQAPVQIIYAITATTSNIFNLQQFSWVGFNATGTNSAFGCSENTDQQSVRFTTTSEGVTVSGQNSTNGFQLGLSGVPGYDYVIEASTNLSDWVPLATNASPFQFTDTNRAAFRHRFYRGRLF
jgi:uncharacterized repeat protein (TIGR01451 family)